MMQSYYEMRPDYDNWQKTRQVSKLPYPYISMYSPLGGEDFLNLEEVIASARPENMTNLSFDEKVNRLTAVYAEADYLHAFWDGNSRVNRAFVQEMARASGIEIDYALMDRNDLYVARDKSLSELNLARRSAEALKGIRYDYTNAYDGLRETLDNLNQVYPNVSLRGMFEQAAKPIHDQQNRHDTEQSQSPRQQTPGSSRPFYPGKAAVEKHLATLRGETDHVTQSGPQNNQKYRP